MEQLSDLYTSVQLESLEQFYQLTTKGTELVTPANLKVALGRTTSFATPKKITQLAVGRKDFKKTTFSKLGSLLELLNLNQETATTSEEYKHFFGAQSLPSFNGSVADFSLDQFMANAQSIDALWVALSEKVLCLSGQKGDILAHNLAFLLEKYTSFLPCGIKHLPDVSLYHHTKLEAAFTICEEIYQQSKEKERLSYLLIGGDLAGIQKFIYDIISKNAAKNLKGRSFYLQLITDSVLQLLLAELGLYKANVIYASGGGFYVLAPNTATIKEKVEQLEKKLSNQLFATHGVNLFLALDAQPFGEKEIFNEGEKSISTVWHRLSEKLTNKKRSRYANKIIQYDPFFNPESAFLDEGGETLRDAITNEEIKPNEHKESLGNSEDDNFVKQTTYEQIQLGKLLRAANFLISSVGKPLKGFKKKETFNPCGFGVYYYLVPDLVNETSNVQILKINDTSFDEDYVENETNVRGYLYYGGNSFPAYKEGDLDENGAVISKDDFLIGTPLSFSSLAKSTNEFHRLGVLRMDVDNLGQSFISGFHESQRTFSRFSNLSSQLDFFFMGYINSLAQTYADNTYILYAGGDDLFIVGHWNAVIDLADTIRTDFTLWNQRNHTLTLSGGLELVPPKFPIVKAADLAAKAEKAAKNYYFADEKVKLEKNAFNFLGTTLQWDNEFEIVKTFKNQLLWHIEEENGSRSFFNKILNLAYLQRTYEKDLQKYGQATPRWFWHCAYQFSQYANTFRRMPTAKNKLDQLRDDILFNGLNGEKLRLPKENSVLQLVAVAARWAEFINRSTKSNKNA